MSPINLAVFVLVLEKPLVATSKKQEAWQNKSIFVTCKGQPIICCNKSLSALYSCS